MALETTLKLSIALPHARKFERDATFDRDLCEPRAIAFQMLCKPRTEIIRVTEVMPCLFVARSKVDQVDISHVRAFLSRDERARRFRSKRVRRVKMIQLNDSMRCFMCFVDRA